MPTQSAEEGKIGAAGRQMCPSAEMSDGFAKSHAPVTVIFDETHLVDQRRRIDDAEVATAPFFDDVLLHDMVHLRVDAEGIVDGPIVFDERAHSSAEIVDVKRGISLEGGYGAVQAGTGAVVRLSPPGGSRFRTYITYLYFGADGSSSRRDSGSSDLLR